MQGEMLYEEKLKLLPPVEIGPVPEGMRLDVPFSGDVSGPSIHGKVDGVDYVLFRPDGAGVMHVHAVITTDGGDRISVEVSGFLTAAPDGHFALKGALTYKTGSKELAWLNSTQGVVEGFVDINKRELNAKIFKF
jgi:hypothetical protein